jgi:hypothetical protein
MWTGYAHEGWRIVRGNDADRIYLIHDDAPDAAIEYVAYGCA